MALELNLTGRKTVITGASEGIGRAIALRMATEGCPLVLAARSEANLKDVKAEIAKRAPVAVEIMPLDLSAGADQRKLFEAASDADILVNNAGAIPSGTIFDVDEAAWRKAFDLKVFGYINLCRSFYGAMKARRRGTIVNIIGNGGERPVSNYIAGACGNAAVMALTRALGGDSHKDGIRVVGINPGPVTTERLVRMMKKRSTEVHGTPDRWRDYEKPFAFGRAGTVEEIADMTAFLASDLSAYTTGTIVTIDGGMIYKGPLF